MSGSVLWLGDNPLLCTGYARVTHKLLLGLKNKGYEVTCIGRGYGGWPYDNHRYPYRILPSGEDYFGSKILSDALDLVRPDCFVALGDLWMLRWIKDINSEHSFSKIAYIPIDGGPLPPSSRGDYKHFDLLTTASQFGARQLLELLPTSRVEVVYHGVDPSIFRPLSQRDSLKQRYGLDGRFVVGCVARNQIRKQFPTLFKAFARFHSKCPKSILFLHTCRDPKGWALDDFAAYFGLTESTRFTNVDVSSGLSDEQLNEIYNLFDVMVLPTAGEGFGLPILEAMSAGVPVMATDYSACSELLNGRGLLVKVKAFIYLGGQITQNALPDEDDLTAKMVQIYLDSELRHDLACKGRSFAEVMDWASTISKWDDIIRRLIV